MSSQLVGLVAIDTTQMPCGFDEAGEERTVTQELPETRRGVTVEEAVNLPETTRLEFEGTRVHRPGSYPGAKWTATRDKAFQSDTLSELVSQLKEKIQDESWEWAGQTARSEIHG